MTVAMAPRNPLAVAGSINDVFWAIHSREIPCPGPSPGCIGSIPFPHLQQVGGCGLRQIARQCQFGATAGRKALPLSWSW